MMPINMRYTSWNIQPPPGRTRCSPQSRAEQGRRFKAMYSSLGFSVADVAKFLQVTPRTVQLWISGRVRIPYAAYKLLRLQLRYELPGEAWAGWSISAGRLYTPEGHELDPRGFTWWSLLVRQASSFRVVYEKNVQMRQELARGCAERAMRATWPALQAPPERDREVLVTPHFSVTGDTAQTPCRWCESKQRRGFRADRSSK